MDRKSGKQLPQVFTAFALFFACLFLPAGPAFANERFFCDPIATQSDEAIDFDQIDLGA